MANEEHLRTLKGGYKYWNKWREENLETRIDLKGANLEGENLKRFNLEGAKLTRANLAGANLDFAKLQHAGLNYANLKGATLLGVNLKGATLFNADLEGAVLGTRMSDTGLLGDSLENVVGVSVNLENAILRTANMKGAILRSARMQGVNLRGAELQGADLFGAQLQEADLRTVSDLRLDNTFIKNAHFSPRATDPWSVLRHTYTGPKLIFQLLAIIAFALPYIGKTAFWSFVNRGQEYTQGLLESIRQRAIVQGIDEQTIVAIGLSPEKFTPLSQCLSRACEQVSVWQLLFGVDQNGLFWSLPVILIIYNILRGGLTYFVAPMRDEEERSGYSPVWTGDKWWQGYRPLYRAHRLVRFLGWIALVAFAYNAYYWLSQPIYLPSSP